jgi:membrane-associated phospholipid phosphatase
MNPAKLNEAGPARQAQSGGCAGNPKYRGKPPQTSPKKLSLKKGWPSGHPAFIVRAGGLVQYTNQPLCKKSWVFRRHE